MTTIAMCSKSGNIYADTMSTGGETRTNAIKITSYVGKNIKLGYGAGGDELTVLLVGGAGCSSVRKRNLLNKLTDETLHDCVSRVFRYRRNSNNSTTLLAYGQNKDSDYVIMKIDINSIETFDLSMSNIRGLPYYAVGSGSTALDLLVSIPDISCERAMAFIIDNNIDEGNTGGYLTSANCETGVLNIYHPEATHKLSNEAMLNIHDLLNPDK